MKKVIAIGLLTATLALSLHSCKKNGGSGNGNGNGGGNNSSLVDVSVERSDTTSLPNPIPALPLSLDFTSSPLGPIQIDTFATKVDEVITPYGFTKDKITEVTLTKMRINIENAPSQTFNFVKDTLTSIQVYVDSFGGSLPKRVAYRQDVPANSNQIEMSVDLGDIKDYFRAQYMKILIGFRTQENEGLDGSAKFRINYTFRIKADTKK